MSIPHNPECGLWEDQRLVLCGRAASSSKPPSSPTSHPDTRTGYNKLKLCCLGWPLSFNPNEAFWCAPEIHSLLFSILFAVPALTGGLLKNLSFHTMPPLGANCSFLPQLPLSHAVLKHHQPRSSLSVGNWDNVSFTPMMRAPAWPLHYDHHWQKKYGSWLDGRRWGLWELGR